MYFVIRDEWPIGSSRGNSEFTAYVLSAGLIQNVTLKKKSSRITECTTSDRENFLVSYAKCYKIFWLSILAQCAIFSGVSCKEEINYP